MGVVTSDVVAEWCGVVVWSMYNTALNSGLSVARTVARSSSAVQMRDEHFSAQIERLAGLGNRSQAREGGGRGTVRREGCGELSLNNILSPDGPWRILAFNYRKNY